jgi:maleylpyruvate isomerase
MDRMLGPRLPPAVEARTDEIVAALADLDEADLLAPSTLPGWSRLTIACHLRYGATALNRLTEAAVRGEPDVFYPGGRAQQRPGTLDPDPGEGPGDVVASLRDHSRRLTDTWAGMADDAWDVQLLEPPGVVDLGPVTVTELAILRLTEVEAHGLDLDLGLSDWSDVFVEAALPFRIGWLARRNPNRPTPVERPDGSWLLAATDGPSYLVTVADNVVHSQPLAPATSVLARATIEASSRDLLALLLGRPLTRPASILGDVGFGAAFGQAFPTD